MSRKLKYTVSMAALALGLAMAAPQAALADDSGGTTTQDDSATPCTRSFFVDPSKLSAQDNDPTCTYPQPPATRSATTSDDTTDDTGNTIVTMSSMSALPEGALSSGLIKTTNDSTDNSSTDSASADTSSTDTSSTDTSSTDTTSTDTSSTDTSSTDNSSTDSASSKVFLVVPGTTSTTTSSTGSDTGSSSDSSTATVLNSYVSGLMRYQVNCSQAVMTKAAYTKCQSNNATRTVDTSGSGS